jgi:hypothetical protein
MKDLILPLLIAVATVALLACAQPATAGVQTYFDYALQTATNTLTFPVSVESPAVTPRPLPVVADPGSCRVLAVAACGIKCKRTISRGECRKLGRGVRLLWWGAPRMKR